MMLEDRHNIQIEFKLLELLNKVNQMLLKLEIEEFEFSNSKLFSEIGNKLDLLDIFLFKFKENDNLHHGHLYAYWRDKNSDKGELNLQNCFFEYYKQFENYFNSYSAFNLQEGIFKWEEIEKDFFDHTLFYLCVPIKLETNFKGFLY